MDNVYIVDDMEEVRCSISFYLESIGYRVRAFATGSDFIANAAGLEAGCVLLDVRMPGLDGFGVLHAALPFRGPLPIVMMTGHGDIAVAVKAMKLGALDFLEKPFADSVLVQTLERVFMQLQRRVEDHGRRAAATARVHSLSNRELDVLNGLITGRSNKLVAYDLGISARTVEMHRASMMERLGVRSLAEALRIAFEGGAIPPGDACTIELPCETGAPLSVSPAMRPDARLNYFSST